MRHQPGLSPNAPATTKGLRLVSLFVRHGETTGNAKDQFRGNIDFPLDKKGVAMADNLNKIFKQVDVGDIYRSDTKRTEQTAEHALDSTGREASVTPDLNAWDTGYLSGKSKSDHKADIKYFTNNPSVKIPGGESLDEFRHRAQPKIKTIIGKGITGGAPSVAFTHSSVIHEVSHMLHGDPHYVKVKPGGMVGVFHDGKKLFAKALFRPGGLGDLNYGG